MADRQQYRPATRGHYRPSSSWRGRGAARGVSFGRAQARPQVMDNANCPLCKETHEIKECRTFKAMSTSRKFAALKRYNLCYKCLKAGHLLASCYRKQECGVRGCKAGHHPLIHPEASSTMMAYEKYSDDVEFDNISEFSYKRDDHTDDSWVKYVAREETIGISTVVCNLVANDEVRKVVALIDTGSSDTLIDEEIARSMGIVVDSDKPFVRRVSYADRGVVCEQYVCQFTIQSLDGLCSKTIEGWTMHNLSRDSPVVDWRQRSKMIAHLRDVPFAELPKDPRINMIIGCDNSGFLRFTECQGDPEDFNAPVAYKTVLGWVCIGANSGLIGSNRSGQQ